VPIRRKSRGVDRNGREQKAKRKKTDSQQKGAYRRGSRGGDRKKSHERGKKEVYYTGPLGWVTQHTKKDTRTGLGEKRRKGGGGGGAKKNKSKKTTRSMVSRKHAQMGASGGGEKKGEATQHTIVKKRGACVGKKNCVNSVGWANQRGNKRPITETTGRAKKKKQHGGRCGGACGGGGLVWGRTRGGNCGGGCLGHLTGGGGGSATEGPEKERNVHQKKSKGLKWGQSRRGQVDSKEERQKDRRKKSKLSKSGKRPRNTAT